MTVISHPELTTSLALQHALFEARDIILNRLGRADTALVLGSGLGDFGNELRDPVSLSYRDIPHMPMPHVDGHSGTLIRGFIGTRAVYCFSGRLHWYEGHDFEHACFASRLCAVLGCKYFLLSNAAGGCVERIPPGSFVILRDHYRGVHADPHGNICGDPFFGPSLMTPFGIWSPNLRKIARDTAESLQIRVFEGTYFWSCGPQYETPAEVKMAADHNILSVGMSTVPEAIAANAMGLEVCAISVVTNPGAGVSSHELNHAEVKEAADLASKSFKRLVSTIVQNLPEYVESGSEITTANQNQINIQIRDEIRSSYCLPNNQISIPNSNSNHSSKIFFSAIESTQNRIVMINPIRVFKNDSNRSSSSSSPLKTAFDSIPFGSMFNDSQSFPKNGFQQDATIQVFTTENGETSIIEIQCSDIRGFSEIESQHLTAWFKSLEIDLVVDFFFSGSVSNVHEVIGSSVLISPNHVANISGTSIHIPDNFGSQSTKSKSLAPKSQISSKLSKAFQSQTESESKSDSYLLSQRSGPVLPSVAESFLIHNAGIDLTTVTNTDWHSHLRRSGIPCFSMASVAYGVSFMRKAINHFEKNTNNADGGDEDPSRNARLVWLKFDEVSKNEEDTQNGSQKFIIIDKSAYYPEEENEGSRVLDPSKSISDSALGLFQQIRSKFFALIPELVASGGIESESFETEPMDSNINNNGSTANSLLYGNVYSVSTTPQSCSAEKITFAASEFLNHHHSQTIKPRKIIFDTHGLIVPQWHQKLVDFHHSQLATNPDNGSDEYIQLKGSNKNDLGSIFGLDLVSSSSSSSNESISIVNVEFKRSSLKWSSKSTTTSTSIPDPIYYISVGDVIYAAPYVSSASSSGFSSNSSSVCGFENPESVWIPWLHFFVELGCSLTVFLSPVWRTPSPKPTSVDGADVEDIPIQIISGFVSMVNPSPLRGPNEPLWGPRFPDMSFPLNTHLQATTRETLNSLGIRSESGIQVLSLPPLPHCPTWSPSYNQNPAVHRIVSASNCQAFSHGVAGEIVCLRHRHLKKSDDSNKSDSGSSDDRVSVAWIGWNPAVVEKAKESMQKSLFTVATCL